VDRFLQAAKSGRHGIRDYLMMLLMYRHGLRETGLCRLAVSALDLESARIWVDRLKGSLSTHHPIDGDELQAIRRYLRIRDSRLPWLFVTEREGQFTRQGVYYLVRRSSERAGLSKVLRTCSAMLVGTRWRTRGMTCAPSRTTWVTETPSTPPSTPERR
jgi:integrase